jgi:soluble lytic murein transglycosylase-like protein
MRYLYRLIAWLAATVAPLTYAATPSPDTLSCTWQSIASKYHGLNPYLLHAIAVQESSLNPAAKGRPNANGSVDIGLMQINSAWLPQLKSRFGITLSHLYHPCINLDVGAWILYENFRTYGYSWRAIGAYNAKNEAKRLAYVLKIYRKMPPALLPQ